MTMNTSELKELTEFLQGIFPEDAFRAWIAMRLFQHTAPLDPTPEAIEMTAKACADASLLLYPQKK